MTAPEEPSVSFLGFAPGAEIFGGVQADFDIRRAGAAAKELSVLLNRPTADFLAETLGVEPSAAFQEQAARDVGLAWVRHCLATGHHLDSVTFLSRSLLESQPAFLESLKGEVTAAA